MAKSLDEVSLEVLQQRLRDELESQRRLQDELETALISERNLRLENDVLWAYLENKYPERVADARVLLERLAEGGDLVLELRNQEQPPPGRKTVRKQVRRTLGALPGVSRIYHGLKNLRK